MGRPIYIVRKNEGRQVFSYEEVVKCQKASYIHVMKEAPNHQNVKLN